jgi:hypothetical protein
LNQRQDGGGEEAARGEAAALAGDASVPVEEVEEHPARCCGAEHGRGPFRIGEEVKMKSPMSGCPCVSTLFGDENHNPASAASPACGINNDSSEL